MHVYLPENDSKAKLVQIYPRPSIIWIQSLSLQAYSKSPHSFFSQSTYIYSFIFFGISMASIDLIIPILNISYFFEIYFL